jgi:succinyl-CoA synthetase alpha subunit
MNFTAETRVLIQGITEALAIAAVPLMRSYGTQVIAGVSPGQGGHKLAGIPVYDLVEQALARSGAVDATLIFVHPYLALDAALEAIHNGIQHVIILTEGMPPLDMVRLLRVAEVSDTLVLGPNSPGVMVPGQVLLGIHPAEVYMPGSIGLISRSGTLTYEIALELTQAGFGQSISVGVGSDAILGSSFTQWLQILDEDERTDAIVLIGEIGGNSEEVAAQYIAEVIDKPVVVYLAGCSAPTDTPLGHAGSIIAAQFTETKGRAAKSHREIGTATSKLAAFKRAKVPVAKRPSQIPNLIKKVLLARTQNIAL